MKFIKKFVAIFAVIAMLFSLSACHGKDEIAATVTSGENEMKFTSAMYAYALISADMEARNTVDAEATSAVEDYYSKQIDGKKFTEWVKERALENLKTYAYYNFKADELGVELTDEEKANSSSMADMYWTNYGYSQTYEANGIGLTTYKTMQEHLTLSNSVFKAIYGTGGEKEVAEKTVKESMYENFEIVNMISVDTNDMEDKEISALKTKFAGYKNRLEKGETFEKIYTEYYGTEAEDHSGHNHDGVESSTDHYATVVGSKDTGYAHDAFDDIKKMKVGEVSVYTKIDGKVILIVRKDLSADKYYSENLKEPTLWLLKETDYVETYEKEIDDYKIDVSKFAINQFKVKKIKYPTNQ